MKKAWLYARTNACDRDAERQMSDLRNHANQRGYVIAGESFDTVKSAFVRHPGLEEMIRKVRRDKIDVVIVPRLSSISHRNRRLLSILKLMQKHRVKLQTTDSMISFELNERRLDDYLLKKAYRYNGFLPW